ncbi:putative paf acetylhydrolase family protein [Neofusicoccum parvum]|uniref:Paf acetylhydrolase family protein n=1 Tax=Neofusicoccum parvum TaxID=310453 RepID=A0ACB5SNC9_9PEZI|nr:putative paf acetylhydrolase family protein [Neofusicoccum parvum]
MILKLHHAALFTVLAHEGYCLSLGHFGVSIKTTSLTDYSRLDPFAPSPQPREVVISTFRPASNSCTTFQETPYMPTNTARFEGSKLSAAYGLPASIFANLTISSASASCSASADHGLPDLLFSPALGTSRHLYNLLAANLASRGYAVTTIDHPYDVDVVEFPNGTLVYGLDFNDTQIPLVVETRAQDMRFVLDSLSRAALHPRCNSTKGTPPVTLALGHSLGGAAALTAAARDSRMQGVVNMDGSVFGDVLNACVTQPVLFIGHEGKNLTTDETWEAIWPRLEGWKELLMLEGSQHYTFSDLPALAASLGLDVSDSEALTGMLGTIKATRAVEIIVGVLDSFVQFMAGKKEANGFDAILREYPEVEVA